MHLANETGNPLQRVLVVDDDPDLLESLGSTLRHSGLSVATAGNGREALARLAQGEFDVVVSDIGMPEVNGLELLRRVHAEDQDLPVILLTGAPSLPSALSAIEHGVHRYFLKPCDQTALAEAVKRAALTRRLTSLRRSFGPDGPSTAVPESAPLAAAEAFDRALASLFVVVQPIVDWPARSVFGYEALLRSEEETCRSPAVLLDTAERLGRITDVGRAVRARSAEALGRAPGCAALFVNLHPAELEDPDLYDPHAPLSRCSARVILEITERARLGSAETVRRQVGALRALGYRVALDDMGAGYAGLTSFTLLEPDVVKIDMSLIRGIDTSPTQARLVLALVEACGALGHSVVAEGVETEGERDRLAELGVALLQGYLFARPAREFTPVSFR